MARSGEEKGRIGRDSDFSRIEELIKENTFSREEISRLFEILNSRAENESEKQISGSNDRVDTHQIVLRNEILGTPHQERQQDIHRASTVGFHENAEVANEVCASPIDIARAYMASCASERGYGKYNFKSNVERAQPSSAFAGKQFLPSPSPKPSMCWPGALLHDGHSTPQHEKARQRINEFAKTPYSRSMLSKSSIKGNPMIETVDASGSVGRIRRIRDKFSSEVRPGISIFSGSAKKFCSRTPQSLERSVVTKQNNLGYNEMNGAFKHLAGEHASEMDVEHPSLSSSRTVRTILEHLDRNKPTPKEKEAELQLVTSWRKSSSIEDNSMHTREPYLDKGPGTSRPSFFGEIRNDSQSRFVTDSAKSEISEAKDRGKGKAIVSDTQFDVHNGADLRPSFSHAKALVSVDKNSNEISAADYNSKQAVPSSIFSSPYRSGNEQNPKVAAGVEFLKNHGAKPSLPSLSISKPGFSSASSENGAVFSFPVSTSSGLLSDPPTPSIFPPSSATTVPVPAIPSYTFSTNGVNTRLVFSFPSSSKESKMPDESVPNFGFGSNHKVRLCFGSLMKDGVCY